MAQKKKATSKKTSKTAKAAKVAKKPTIKKNTLENLRRWNIGAAVLHAIQGVLILVFSRNVAVPITTSYLTSDSLATQAAGQTVLAPASRHLFDINLAYLLAALFFVAAISHVLFATVYRKKYEADLKKGLNIARWIEYAVGGGLLLIIIGLVNGVYDFSTLLAIFALAEVAALFALIVESQPEVANKHPRAVNKLAFVAGVTSWLITAVYLFGAQIYGTSSLPAYVYWIDVTIFAAFILVAINYYFQQNKKGRWADYLYGEKMFTVLSLATKTALAWQIYAGLLRK